jgi:hypothetical protein
MARGDSISGDANNDSKRSNYRFIVNFSLGAGNAE